MKKRMDPQALLTELRTLQGQAGANYYRRTALAAQLLADRQWLEAEHRGNEIKAAKAIEDVYFHDVCGLLSLWDLLAIVRKFPDEAQWAARGYHLRRLREACKVKGKKRTRRQATLAELYAAQQALERAQAELDEVRPRLKSLERENERLKGRVEELERILERFGAKKTA